MHLLVLLEVDERQLVLSTDLNKCIEDVTSGDGDAGHVDLARVLGEDRAGEGEGEDDVADDGAASREVERKCVQVGIRERGRDRAG